jgi:hypothetical protein
VLPSGADQAVGGALSCCLHSKGAQRSSHRPQFTAVEVPTSRVRPVAIAVTCETMSGVMLSSAAATGFTLDWIVHPTTATHFLDHCWERQPHLVGRQDPAYFADLPRIDAVDELIVATAPTATRSRDDGHLVRTGPDGTTSHRAFPIGADGLPDIHSVYRGYSDGFSIVLTGSTGARRGWRCSTGASNASSIIASGRTSTSLPAAPRGSAATSTIRPPGHGARPAARDRARRPGAARARQGPAR